VNAHRRRMKLRGYSRRSRQRIITLTVHPHARLEYNAGKLTVHMLTTAGTHTVEVETTHDGFGRRVGPVKTTITPKTPLHRQETPHA
jgi:hypothetical protein